MKQSEEEKEKTTSEKTNGLHRMSVNFHFFFVQTKQTIQKPQAYLFIWWWWWFKMIMMIIMTQERNKFLLLPHNKQ